MIKDLPKKLQSLRLQHGFSQKQVANKIGVSSSIISGYETGERTPSTDVLLSLAYLYNVSTDFLLGRHVDLNSSYVDVTGLSNKQVNAIVKLIESIKETE